MAASRSHDEDGIRHPIEEQSPESEIGGDADDIKKGTQPPSASTGESGDEPAVSLGHETEEIDGRPSRESQGRSRISPAGMSMTTMGLPSESRDTKMSRGMRQNERFSPKNTARDAPKMRIIATKQGESPSGGSDNGLVPEIDPEVVVGGADEDSLHRFAPRLTKSFVV